MERRMNSFVRIGLELILLEIVVTMGLPMMRTTAQRYTLPYRRKALDASSKTLTVPDSGNSVQPSLHIPPG